MKLAWLAPLPLALAAACGRVDAAPKAGVEPAREPERAAKPRDREAPRATPASVAKPEEGALASARIAGLKLASGQAGLGGVFVATLEGPDVPAGAHAELRLATNDAPVRQRRRLAFHRLAAALGGDVVPACAERDVGLGELGGALAGDHAGLAVVRQRARVMNDGTVSALLLAPGTPASGAWSEPEGRPVETRGREIASWGRWANGEEHPRAADAALPGDYVAWLALDYLAATTLRLSVFVTRDPAHLVLFDNEHVFPLNPSRAAVDATLVRLRAVRRFPRALRDGLAALDEARARQLFTGGSFEDWLLTPRQVVEFSERRAALLSLVEARGEAALTP